MCCSCCVSLLNFFNRMIINFILFQLWIAGLCVFSWGMYLFSRADIYWVMLGVVFHYTNKYRFNHAGRRTTKNTDDSYSYSFYHLVVCWYALKNNF